MPLYCTHQLLGESEEYSCYWNETWLVSQVMSRIWSLAYFLQAIRLVLTQHYVLSLSPLLPWGSSDAFSISR